MCCWKIQKIIQKNISSPLILFRHKHKQTIVMILFMWINKYNNKIYVPVQDKTWAFFYVTHCSVLVIVLAISGVTNRVFKKQWLLNFSWGGPSNLLVGIYYFWTFINHKLIFWTVYCQDGIYSLNFLTEWIISTPVCFPSFRSSRRHC